MTYASCNGASLSGRRDETQSLCHTKSEFAPSTLQKNCSNMIFRTSISRLASWRSHVPYSIVYRAPRLQQLPQHPTLGGDQISGTFLDGNGLEPQCRKNNFLSRSEIAIRGVHGGRLPVGRHCSATAQDFCPSRRGPWPPIESEGSRTNQQTTCHLRIT